MVNIVLRTPSFSQAHGILMVVVWVFFFPAGVLAARYLHHLDPLWWHLHRAFQGFGFVLFAIALGLSLKAKAIDGRYSTPHKALGVFLLVAVCLQVTASPSTWQKRLREAASRRFGPSMLLPRVPACISTCS